MPPKSTRAALKRIADTIYEKCAQENWDSLVIETNEQNIKFSGKKGNDVIEFLSFPISIENDLWQEIGKVADERRYKISQIKTTTIEFS